MTGQPWGRTGWVTLRPHNPGGVWFCVDLAGRHLGVVSIANEILADTAATTACPLRRTGRPPQWSDSTKPFPTLDHAVMWVLRRTRPDVWRAERPVVLHAYPGTYRNVPATAHYFDQLARTQYVARVERAYR